MYTRTQVGKELKEKVSQKESCYKIGSWASGVFYDILCLHDRSLRGLLIDLMAMQSGEEFELSYEELDKIADDLINCDKNGANEILANAEVFLLKQIELSDFCESIEKILNTIDDENIKSEVTNVLLGLKQLSGSLPEV